MTLNRVTVVFYIAPSGACPVRDFLGALPPKIYRKALWTLQTVQTFGRAGSHYFKALSGTRGLYEVRVTASRGDLRLLGFFATGDLFILAHGFMKKSTSTPRSDIQVALDRRREYSDGDDNEAR